jgi:hypothetical protein
MNKISINRLCSTNFDNGPSPLDVNTISKQTMGNIKKDPMFSLQKLIDKRIKIDQELEDIYTEIFETCLNQINVASDYDLTETLFEPPLRTRSTNYRLTDCLELISKRLEKLYIDSTIIVTGKLYISWKNIIENKKKAESASQSKEEVDDKDYKYTY